MENLQKVGRAGKYLLKGENREIFLIYLNSNSQLTLGVLNLDSSSNEEANKPFPAHDYQRMEAFEQKFPLVDSEDDIKELIGT